MVSSPPHVSANEKIFPTVGLVGQNKKFVALPLLTSLLCSILYTGLSTRVEGKHLLFVKGSFLKTPCGIKEKDWVDTESHYDFNPSVQVKGEVAPITFMISLKGETPLDFGSVARDPTRSDRKKNVEEKVLKCGDGVVFSWRQEHQTGRPKKFPTKMNHRCHFMLSGCKSEVDDTTEDEVYIHPNPL